MRQMCETLMKTADHFQIQVKLLGVGHEFIEHKQRLQILYDFLIQRDSDELIVCMDGSDTLFNDTAGILVHKFKSMGTHILISAERAYSYQYPKFKGAFDQITSDYRYVNAGTFMGYASALVCMLEDIFQLNLKYPNANDQGLIGIWVYLNLSQPEKVKLDTETDIFWVTTNDWNALKKVSLEKDVIFNPHTLRKPSIIHNVGNGHPIHQEIYQNASRNILNRHSKNVPRVFVICPIGHDLQLCPPINNHPHIHAFFYGQTDEIGPNTIATSNFHEAIHILKSRYFCDCIVHIPKGYAFNHDELYNYVLKILSETTLDFSLHKEFPIWESFMYHEDYYFPIDCLVRLDRTNEIEWSKYEQETIATYTRRLWQKIKLSGFRIIYLEDNDIDYSGSNSLKDLLVMESIESDQIALQEMNDFTEIWQVPSKETPNDLSEKPTLFIRICNFENFQERFAESIKLNRVLTESDTHDNDHLLLLTICKDNFTGKLGRYHANIMIWQIDEQTAFQKDHFLYECTKAIEICLDEYQWAKDQPHLKMLS
jgi:hypothetical protein